MSVGLKWSNDLAANIERQRNLESYQWLNFKPFLLYLN